MGELYHNLPTPVLQDHQGRGGRKTIEPEVKEAARKSVYTGHDRTTTLMSSQ